MSQLNHQDPIKTFKLKKAYMRPDQNQTIADVPQKKMLTRAEPVEPTLHELDFIVLQPTNLPVEIKKESIGG